MLGDTGWNNHDRADARRVTGGYGPNLRRPGLILHAQGQVTTGRLTTLLNDIGVEMSKRQVVRLLTRTWTASLRRMRRCSMQACRYWLPLSLLMTPAHAMPGAPAI